MDRALYLGALLVAYRYVYSYKLPLNDVLEAVAAPLPPVTGSLLLLRYYERTLVRCSYIALLVYWFFFISGLEIGDSTLFNTLLMELLRTQNSKHGETDEFGRHWTLNVAETFSSIAINKVMVIIFPDRFWSLTVFNVFLTLFVFGHHVFQLWMQKQLALLSRWSRNAWTWRDFAIEYACSSITRYADSPFSRRVMRIWWWAWYLFYQFMTPDLMKNLCFSYFILSIVVKSNPYSRYLRWAINWILLYRTWFQELIKFSNPNPPKYKYMPLKASDHIRVLLLQPRFGFRPISCNLVQGPNMRLLTYEAISYNWGNMETSEEILVDGCVMKVTKSVYEILCSYSSHFFPRLLWIDAICINQEDMAEKSQQVPLMQKIYQSALFTTVFLGQSPLPETNKKRKGMLLPFRYDGIYAIDDCAKEHFESARLVFDLFNEFRILKDPLRSSGKDIYELYEMLRPSKSKPKQWVTLLKLLQHPWFTRVWVVQEVALSPEVRVRYGDETIDWDILADGMQMLHNSRHFRLWLEWAHDIQLRHIQHTSLFNVLRMHRFREKLHPKGKWQRREYATIPDALRESFYFTATNPRDQIFGLMSLCRDPLPVDYNMSVEDAYLSAAKEILQEGAIHLLLHAAGVGNRSGNSPLAPILPSWVPDWTDAPSYDSLQTTLEKSRDTIGKLKGKDKPEIELREERVLAFSATYIDTVAELGPVVFEMSSQATGGVLDEMHCLATNWAKCLETVTNSVHLGGVYLKTTPHQTPREAFQRTVLCNRQRIKWSKSIEEFLPDFSEWEQKLAYFRRTPTAQSSSDKDRIYNILQDMDNTTELVESCCGGRRLFITAKGFIGLCPPLTQAGDSVHVVPRIEIPVLLRRASKATRGSVSPESSMKRYHLVGECYCHGLMDGRTASIGSLQELEII